MVLAKHTRQLRNIGDKTSHKDKADNQITASRVCHQYAIENIGIVQFCPNYSLSVMVILNCFGELIINSFGSFSVDSGSPSGAEKEKFCSIDSRKMTTSTRASGSPRHARRPETNEF